VDPSHTPPSIWRQRDFRIAWSAGFINNTGDWVLNLALPVFVFIETRSGATTAVLFVCQLLVAAMLGPIGGALVDRFDLRRCLVATNLGQAATLPLLLLVSADRVWPAYVVVIAQSALTQLNDPANAALVPRVVAEGQLTAANAALSAAQSLARLIGAPAGGLLVAWQGLAPIVVIDGLSFVLVAASLAFLRADTSPLPDPEGAPGLQFRAGWRTARTHPPVLLIILLHSAAQIAQGGFLILFVAFVVESLGDDGSALGVIRGAMAIGGLVGAALIGRAAHRVHPPTLFGIGLIGMGIVSYVFWNMPMVTTATWVYVVVLSTAGIPGSACAVGLYTTIQTTSPRHALGRVMGLFSTFEAIGTAFGSIVTGILIDVVDLRVLLNAQATVYVLAGSSAVLLLRHPLQRD
jgi:predicted MFS family arabinose efflux permease